MVAIGGNSIRIFSGKVKETSGKVALTVGKSLLKAQTAIKQVTHATTNRITKKGKISLKPSAQGEPLGLMTAQVASPVIDRTYKAIGKGVDTIWAAIAHKPNVIGRNNLKPATETIPNVMEQLSQATTVSVTDVGTAISDMAQQTFTFLV